jgi:succinate-semialdehyde dehydrogenase / glutarate-semialdehyde dehydrogenase
VLNLVFGTPSEISEYLIRQQAVRLVTFTGSIPVGKRLAALAGQHMKPAIMELGGHAPVIVCDDVDPAASAATSVIGKSRNAGQVCVSPTRFYVQEAIYDGFAAAFAAKAREVKVGDGLDPASTTSWPRLPRRHSAASRKAAMAVKGEPRDLSATPSSRTCRTSSCREAYRGVAAKRLKP